MTAAGAALGAAPPWALWVWVYVSTTAVGPVPVWKPLLLFGSLAVGAILCLTVVATAFVVPAVDHWKSRTAAPEGMAGRIGFTAGFGVAAIAGIASAFSTMSAVGYLGP